MKHKGKSARTMSQIHNDILRTVEPREAFTFKSATDPCQALSPLLSREVERERLCSDSGPGSGSGVGGITVPSLGAVGRELYDIAH